MIEFVELLLSEGLNLPTNTDLQVEWAHHALASEPLSEVPPRAIMAKLSNFLGNSLYGSVEEAMADMGKQGLPVTVIGSSISRRATN